MKLVQIGLKTVSRREFRIASLDGAGELLAEPADPRSARLILAHLAQGEEHGWIEQLPAATFDRLCAAVFETEFGTTAECRSACRACGDTFGFEFDLGALITAQDRSANDLGLGPDEEGYWKAEGHLSLRPPRIGDLDMGLEPAELARTIVRSGQPDDPRIEALLEEAAPLLTLNIGTNCPHCGEPQEVAFDMAAYLVASIGADRPFLIREAHLIATRYGWNHESIMALPRKDRRAYAALIESERSAALARRPA